MILGSHSRLWKFAIPIGIYLISSPMLTSGKEIPRAKHYGLYHNGTANVTTINQYIEGLTISPSAAIRATRDARGSSYVEGSVLVSQTCIRTHWG